MVLLKENSIHPLPSDRPSWTVVQLGLFVCPETIFLVCSSLVVYAFS